MRKSGFQQKVKALFQQHDFQVGEGLLFCALSGGADSVALLLVLKELGFEVKALHCNFHLRGEESDRDERFVRDFCAEQGVSLEVCHFDTRAEAAKTGESIEMAARRLRYEWFSGFENVCVAHHADDNVETLLLNIIRGAGLHGLTGMEFCNEAGILRPLLGVTRAEILAYLEKKKQIYVTDSSNADTHYRRNKVRHELLPLLREMNPSIDKTLLDMMAYLSQAESELFLANPLRYMQLQQLQRLGFNRSQILQVEQGRNGAFVEQNGIILTNHQNKLVWGEIPEQVEKVAVQADFFSAGNRRFYARVLPVESVISLRDKDKAVLDVDKLKGPLYVRSCREGDRFHPFGLKGSKLVSDYLTDRKRSRIEKLSALVVCDDDGILWLVGETIDQRAAVTSTTQRVLTIAMVPDETV